MPYPTQVDKAPLGIGKNLDSFWLWVSADPVTWEALSYGFPYFRHGYLLIDLRIGSGVELSRAYLNALLQGKWSSPRFPQCNAHEANKKYRKIVYNCGS